MKAEASKVFIYLNIHHVAHRGRAAVSPEFLQVSWCCFPRRDSPPLGIARSPALAVAIRGDVHDGEPCHHAKATGPEIR